MFTKGEVLAAGANAETSGSNMEINVGLMLSLMEKHGAHSEMLYGQPYKSGQANMEENIKLDQE